MMSMTPGLVFTMAYLTVEINRRGEVEEGTARRERRGEERRGEERRGEERRGAEW
jgi:hypothetical protein